MLLFAPALVLAQVGQTIQDQLVYGAESGSASKIKALLHQGGDPNGFSPEMVRHGSRLTPLWMAVSGGNVGALQALLQAGADPNKPGFIKGGKGSAPIFVAIARDRMDCLALLLKSGVKTTIKNDRGETPLRLAERLNRPRAVGWLKNPATISAALPANKGKENPTRPAGHVEHVVGTWAIETYGAATPPGKPLPGIRLGALQVMSDGRYDSEGFFGSGTWTYRGPTLLLTPRLGSLAQFFQSPARTAPTPTISLEVRKESLRLYAHPSRYPVQEWYVLHRTHRPLAVSSARGR